MEHSGIERRWFALGKTNAAKRLFVVFTLRKNKIRIISSRDMNRKKQNTYEKAGTAIFPDLKPTMKTISLRLPEQMLNRIKVLANERDVPYQSLLKMFLKERIDREYEPKRNKPRSSRKANA